MTHFYNTTGLFALGIDVSQPFGVKPEERFVNQFCKTPCFIFPS